MLAFLHLLRLQECIPFWMSASKTSHGQVTSDDLLSSHSGHPKLFWDPYLGVSENSVPLNPMVLLIIIPIKWL
jgi:hypothetical protein